MQFDQDRVDMSIEKNIIYGMIQSTTFLSKVAMEVKDITKVLESRASKLIAEWCLLHYTKYGSAPRRNIHVIAKKKMKVSNADDDVKSIVTKLIKSAKSKFSGLNKEFLWDEAKSYIRKLRLKHLSQRIDDYVDVNDVSGAEVEVSNFYSHGTVEINEIESFLDKEAIYEAFEDDTDPVILLPGDIGNMMNQYLTKESLVALMGPEKRGKSWWLQELAIRACKSRKNVAYFQVGDMSKKQVIRRKGINLTGRSNVAKYCRPTWVPILDCQYNQQNSCTKKHRTCRVCAFDQESEDLAFHEIRKKIKYASPSYRACTYCKDNGEKGFKGTVWYKRLEEVYPLTWKQTYHACKKFASTWMQKTKFKLLVYPNKGLNVHEIDTVLTKWRSVQNWTPDVIVIDYADNLGVEPGGSSREFRHQQNDTWSALSALRLKWHCLVITATQSDSKSYDVANIKLANFSEDKRKYAHVTAVFTLNQVEEERENGLMRVAPLLLREGNISTKDEVCVLQCLQRGKTLLDSFYI